MKKATFLLFLLLTLTATIVFGETTAPCKEIVIPADLENGKVIFQIPTYDEYIKELVQNSVNGGAFVDEKNILTESTFKKVREAKIKTLKEAYDGDYDIMGAREVALNNITSGYLFEEELISSLVSGFNHKFEQYTVFSIRNLSTGTRYILADPSQSKSANCFVEKGKYKYEQLITLLQKR